MAVGDHRTPWRGFLGGSTSVQSTSHTAWMDDWIGVELGGSEGVGWGTGTWCGFRAEETTCPFYTKGTRNKIKMGIN